MLKLATNICISLKWYRIIGKIHFLRKDAAFSVVYRQNFLYFVYSAYWQSCTNFGLQQHRYSYVQNMKFSFKPILNQWSFSLHPENIRNPSRVAGWEREERSSLSFSKIGIRVQVLWKNALIVAICGLNFSFKMSLQEFPGEYTRYFSRQDLSFMCCRWDAWRSTLIPRNLPCLEIFLVTRLKPEVFSIIFLGYQKRLVAWNGLKSYSSVDNFGVL